MFLGFDHLDMRVANLRAVEMFYDAFLPRLGLTKKVYAVVRGDDWRFSDEPSPGYNAVEFHEPQSGAKYFFGIIEDPEHHPTSTRIAFRVANRAAIDEWIALLPTLGARNVEACEEMETYPAVFFEDPLGTKLELLSRR